MLKAIKVENITLKKKEKSFTHLLFMLQVAEVSETLN